MDVPPLEPGCPWYALSELGRPDIDWCEAARCSLIVEPANTWSNLAYVLAAGLLWRRAGRLGSASPGRWFALTALAVGVTSFVYHASYTFAFQVLDFVGMFLFLGLALALNLERLGGPRRKTVWTTVVLGGTVAVFVLRFFGIQIQPIVGVLLLGIFGSEAACRTRLAEQAPYRYYGLAVVLLGLAGLFSLLDVTRTWCDPSNPVLQGHAVWHVLGAAAMIPLSRFYEGVARG